MDRIARQQLEKLDRFQSELRKLEERYRAASLASSAAKWTAGAGLVVALAKLLPSVSYHEIGVALSGVAVLVGLAAAAIWVEQRGKANQLLRDAWRVSDNAEKGGVNLDTWGNIKRDDLGSPISPFAPTAPEQQSPESR